MRSALVALAVAVLAVLILARSNLARAEPPPAMEEREIGKVIDALKQSKSLRPNLATARFYAEVFGGKTVHAPVGSSLTTLGPWGDDGNLLASEGAMNNRGCASGTPAEKKAAIALLNEFGKDLPSSLRGYALLEQGKNEDAADLFEEIIDGALPFFGGCPGEHPMYSHRRVARMSMALTCLKRAAPTMKTEGLEKKIGKAKSCASNNHAVG